MCSTCNYKNFETVFVNGTTKLQSSLGTGDVVMRCDTTGHNWKLSTCMNEEEFALYWCPTCGKKL